MHIFLVNSLELVYQLKSSPKNIKTVISSGIRFSKESLLFMAFFMNNVKTVHIFNCEPFCAEDYKYRLLKTKCLRPVHVPMNVTDIPAWANLINDKWGKVAFHVNMLDRIPAIQLQHPHHL
jgi:hypothetical protein